MSEVINVALSFFGRIWSFFGNLFENDFILWLVIIGVLLPVVIILIRRFIL